MRANRERGEHETENAGSCSGPNGDGTVMSMGVNTCSECRFQPGNTHMETRLAAREAVTRTRRE